MQFTGVQLCTSLIRLSIAYIILSLLCFVSSVFSPEVTGALDMLRLLVWLASVVFLCLVLNRFKATMHKGQLVQHCSIAWGIMTILRPVVALYYQIVPVGKRGRTEAMAARLVFWLFDLAFFGLLIHTCSKTKKALEENGDGQLYTLLGPPAGAQVIPAGEVVP